VEVVDVRRKQRRKRKNKQSYLKKGR